MNEHGDMPPPLDDELADLLGSVGDVSPPPDTMARVRARVDATLALPPPDGEPPGSSAGSSPASAPTSAVAEAAARALLVKVAAVAFMLGAGAGATVMHLATSGGRATVRIERPVSSERPAVPSPALSAPAVDAAASVVASDAGAPRTTRDAGVASIDGGTEALGSGRDRALADENALVTRAQSALARGRAGEALEALAEHQRRFPGGQFAEEREAMTIQALVRLGRVDAARARAERFRARFPGSMLLRAVESALGPPE